MMLAEMQRLASHIIWLATHALDIGAMSPFFYTFEEREKILDLFEDYCGARLTLNAMRVGGQPYDLPEGWTDRLRVFVDQLPDRIAEWERLLTDNRIWKLRTVGVGVISAADAVNWGLTGPPLRGSGSGGTCARPCPTRATTRWSSTSRSARTATPSTAIWCAWRRCGSRCASSASAWTAARRPGDGQGAQGHQAAQGRGVPLVEGPKGELGFYLVSDGSTQPYRLHVRPSSFINLQVLPEPCAVIWWPT